MHQLFTLKTRKARLPVSALLQLSPDVNVKIGNGINQAWNFIALPFR
jgi:hypothetical protein